MRSGDLKKRIELQASSKVSDGMGGFLTSWSTIATVWAGIWPLRGDELIEGMKLTAQITHRIRIRYRENVKSSMKIKFGSKYFSISAPPINPGMNHEMLDLMCKEVI